MQANILTGVRLGFGRTSTDVDDEVIRKNLSDVALNHVLESSINVKAEDKHHNDKNKKAFDKGQDQSRPVTVDTWCDLLWTAGPFMLGIQVIVFAPKNLCRGVTAPPSTEVDNLPSTAGSCPVTST